MGKSKTGGAFGFIKKSIGSVTYSTIKDKNGKRVQILRSKPTDVANPNTVPQILQRMKVKPAARFYKAFEEILNNAFEGVQYGPDSRREFMSLAMAADGPFIPKSADRFIPAKYAVSRGQLPDLNLNGVRKCGMENMSSPLMTKTGLMMSFTADGQSDTGTPSQFANEKYGGDVQITCLAVKQETDGTFVPMYARVLTSDLNSGNSGAVQCDGFYLFYQGNFIYAVKGTYVSGAPVADDFEAIKAGIFIISRKDGDAWVRTNCDMTINPALELNLYGSDARDLAIESYQDSASVNNLNSTWYLNLANGQQYPGNLSLQTEDFSFSVQEETVIRDLTYPYGSLVDANGRVTNQVFADASGDMIFYVNGQYTTVENPEDAGHNIKWSDIELQSRLYGNVRSVETWKSSYVLQIES